MPVDPIAGLPADEIIRVLDLRPHPEGGYFRETFRDPAQDFAGPGRLDIDLLSAEGWRGFALAQGRCRRDLALLWRGGVGNKNFTERR